MMRSSLNEVTTFRWSLAEDLHFYHAAGWEAIGLWRRKLADFGDEKAIELVRESELAVSSLSWAGGFTGSEGHTSAESIADARLAIELAAELNAGCLVIYSGGRNHHIRTHALRLLRSAFEQLLPLAERNGVTLALEPMHHACAAEWTFLTSPRDALALIDEYASPRLKLALDTYHFPHLASIGLTAADLTDRLALVQVGDARAPHSIDQDRCPLGHGGVPNAKLLRSFLDAGYKGDFEVKLIGHSVEHIAYENLVTDSLEALLDCVAADLSGR